MKRLIEFKCSDSEYYLEENGDKIFQIEISDLKFDSLKFYKSLYEGKTPRINIVNSITEDTNKKGNYIFNWLSDIISDINKEFPETSEELQDSQDNVKIIPLFEFAACAGDGFYLEENIPHTNIPDESGESDFAVTISGNSMEPTIKDKSIVYVKRAEELQHKDVGLFVINGSVMCKRFIKKGKGVFLEPDNKDGHKTYSKSNIESYKLLGKIIL